jgi:hypothetical protein
MLNPNDIIFPNEREAYAAFSQRCKELCKDAGGKCSLKK